MERNYQNPNLIRYFEKYVSQMEVDTNFKLSDKELVDFNKSTKQV